MRSVSEAPTAFEALLHGARRALINPLFVALLSALLLAGAHAEESPPPVRAEAAGFTDQGYGRLLLTFSEETKATVHLSNGILIVSFAQPIELSVASLKDRLADYVQAVRRDPDNGAIRLSLSRKVSVNVMEAGKKLFVDLLPDGWTGLPPGLPQDVVDDLAKRAREAERQARMNDALPRKTWAPVKLRYAAAPNFFRFAFEMPEPIATATAREGQELRVTFAAPVKIDFGEARAKLPESVTGLEAQYENEETIVKLVLAPGAGMRSFREDTAFTVDVMPPEPGAKPAAVEGKASDEESEKTPVAAEPNAVAVHPAKPMPPGESPGPRPYEMVWAGRKPAHVPLVSFDSLDGWQVEC